MEAAAHSQNICHYAIITTDNREQANFRLNRNYDIGRRAKHSQPLFFWHLFHRFILCIINKCLFLPRLTCIYRCMYGCNNNALRKMLCRFQVRRSSRHPQLWQTDTSCCKESHSFLTWQARWNAPRAIWFNSCIQGKSQQKTLEKGRMFKKKIRKVIGRTFCPSHWKRTNRIFFCRSSHLATLCGFLLVREVTIDVCHHSAAFRDAPPCLAKLPPVASPSSSVVFNTTKSQPAPLQTRLIRGNKICLFKLRHKGRAKCQTSTLAFADYINI